MRSTYSNFHFDSSCIIDEYSSDVPARLGLKAPALALRRLWLAQILGRAKAVTQAQ